MKVRRFIRAGLLTGCLFGALAHAKPFSLQHGERPRGWKVVGGNEVSWRFLNGALNSGNGDAEDYGNPSYFFQAEPGDLNRRDYVVEATVRSFQENGTFTLLARFQDPSNYYGLEYRDLVRRGRVRLVKLDDGDIRHEKTVGHGFGYDNITIPDMKLEPVRLRIEVRGNRIRATVNDQLEMVMEDDAFERGATGFGNFFYQFEILDFEVTDLVGPVKPPDIAAAAPARIEFRQMVTEDEAQALKAFLDSQRVANVEVVKEGEWWTVRTAPYPTVAQARVVLDVLEREGITGGDIVPVGAAEAPPVPPVPAAVRYAVVVAEYGNQDDAVLHQDSLREAGYLDARVGPGPAAGTYRILVGEFDRQQDASEFAAQMAQGGFTNIGTTAVSAPLAAGPGVPAADVGELTEVLVRRVLAELGGGLPDRDAVTEAIGKYSDLLSTMEERDQLVRNLEERIRQMMRAQEDLASKRQEDEQRELDRLLAEARAHIQADELDDARIKCNMVLQKDPYNRDARTMIASISKRELEIARAEARGQREEEIRVRLGTARTLVAQGDYEDARIQLNTVLGLGIRLDELSDLTRQEIDEARELVGTVDERLRQKQLDSLNRLAVQAAENDALDLQLHYLNEMLLLSPDDEAIAARVAAVQQAINKRAQSGEKDRRKHQLILYGLVIFVALFALFYVLTWLLYRRQEEQVEREELEVPQITYEPATDNFQEEEPAFLEESATVNLGSVISAEAEQRVFADVAGGAPPPPGKGVAVAEPPQPGGPTPREERPPAAEAPPPAPEEEEEEEEEVALTQPPADRERAPSRTESLEDLFSEPETTKTETAPSFGDIDLLGPVGREGEETPVAETEDESLEPEPFPSSLFEEDRETVEPETAPEPSEATGALEAVLPEPVEGNLLFKQGFDELESGSRPPNWEHTGGALAVEGAGCGGIGKCLRFRKSSGEDAYAHCRFPGIHNIFRFEFDLKSEHDIEGQIQIVIEHDEQAEGLVHVAAAAGGAEIYLQGVKTESDPGQWRHIKFIINLDKQVVNGFVDGKLVAYKVALPAPTPEVNAMSILGDASASGSVLIDNIKVYRV